MQKSATEPMDASLQFYSNLVCKDGYFMIEDCTRVNWMKVKSDDEHRMLIIENYMIHFSYTEYALLGPLLKNGIASDDIFFKALKDDRCTLDKILIDKYMSRIRNKLKIHGLDVHRIHRYGYILLPGSS